MTSKAFGYVRLGGEIGDGVFGEDPALLLRFREGHPEVLAKVYRANVRPVERYLRKQARAYGVTGLVQSSAIADLLQETFIRAFSRKARQSYDGHRDYLAFLVGIARNCLVDLLRKHGREVVTDPADDCFDIDPDPDPESQWDSRLLTAVSGYLDQLPSPLRDVYRQRFVLGKSQEEASLTLGLSRRSLRTAEQHLRRGVRRALFQAGISLSDLRAHKVTVLPAVRPSNTNERTRG